MKLELAEGRGGYRGYKARYEVHGYDRSANYVPGYSLNDSSLFSFRLNDAVECVAIPDPLNVNPPVYVQEDILDELPDTEFGALIDYIAPFNDAALLGRVIQNRQQGNRIVNAGPSAIDLVNSLHGLNDMAAVSPLPAPTPNPIQPSFWDTKIFGIPTKYIAGGAAAYLLLK